MLAFILNKFWYYVRPHVIAILLTAGVLILGYTFFTRQRDGFIDRLQKQQAIYDEEIKKITAAQEVERKQHEENFNRLQTALDQARQKYDEQISSLEKKKADRVTALVHQFDSDPTGMAKELSELTGFKLVLQEKK